MKKFLIFIICLCLLMTAAVGCSGEKNLSGKTTAEPVQYLASNGLDIGDYSIVYAAGAPSSTVTAASELQKYINSATGKTPAIKTDASAAGSAEILLGATNRPETASINYSILGREGFTLKTEGIKLLIAGDESARGKARGVLYGVYSFLELLGFRFLSTDTEIIPHSSAVFVPQTLNKTEIPKLEFRDVTYESAMWHQNTAWAVKQKINSYFTRDTSSGLGGSETFAGGSGAAGLVHTMRHLVPSSAYFSAHPEYFALLENGQRDASADAQVCYTNPNVFNITLSAARARLNSMPDAKCISISINSNPDFCQCSNCKAAYSQYGMTGVALDFTNRIAEALENDGRTNEVIFLAYGPTEALPKGGIVPRANVIVQLADSGVCANHGYGDGGEYTLCTYDRQPVKVSADAMKRQLAGWNALSNKLYIYDYCANYYRHNAPFPNYRAVFNNIKTYAENGVKGIFSSGVGYPSGEFGELKAYMYAKLLWNPDMSETEYYRHMSEFAEGYYGAGSFFIQEYIDLTMEMTKNLHFSRISDMFYTFHTPGTLGAQTYTSDMTFIGTANQLFYNAMYYSSDVKSYQHIEKSSIQILFYELYMTMNKRYDEGSPTQKAELVAKNKKMYLLMKTYKATSVFIDGFIDVQNDMYANDYTRSPKTFLLQDLESRPTQYINYPY